MATRVTVPPPLDVSYTDDPRVVKEAAEEDYSLHVVPLTWRMPRGRLAMAWSALASAFAWLVFGATVGLAVGTVDALIGMSLATIAYGTVNLVLARAAVESGLTVALFSRTLFGYVGAALASLVFAATAIYYCILEGSVIAIAGQAYFGGDINVWYLGVVVLGVALVLRGIRVWLDRFNGALLPFYVVGITAAVIWAIAEYGYSGSWFTYEPETTAGISGPGWWFAFTVYMGVAVLMMYTWDYARFGRREDRRFNGFVTFGPVFYMFALLVNGTIGIFLAQTIPSQGPLSAASVVVGIVGLMALAGFLLILVGQTRINTMNFYLASTNLESLVSRFARVSPPRWVWAIVAGGIAYAIMRTNVFSFILDALRYQGVVVVSWVAITLVHLVLARRRGLTAADFEFRPGRVPLINPAGVGAWAAGAGVGVVMLASNEPFTNTWAAPFAFVIAGAAYAGLHAIARPGWFTLSRPADPRDEVDDAWSARIRCAGCDKAYVAVEMDRHPGTGDPLCGACADQDGSLHALARREARTAAAGPSRVAVPSR